jgi:hypothetical protein
LEAARRKQSLKRIIVEKLVNATRVRADFSALAGAWALDPEFDTILAAQRETDLGQRK